MCDQLSAGQQEALGQNKNIKALHPDVPVSTQQIPKVQKQKNAPWHLDRIDQQNLPLDGLYDYTLDGSGINVYILDTVRALSAPTFFLLGAFCCLPQSSDLVSELHLW